MNKTSKIALAAALAASLGYATPTLALQTTARDFVDGLSADFANGNLTSVEVKLGQISSQGFEGILIDDELMSLGRLMEILAGVQEGQLDADRVAARLRNVVRTSTTVRFIYGDVRVEVVDLDSDSQFPAGSAG